MRESLTLLLASGVKARDLMLLDRNAKLTDLQEPVVSMKEAIVARLYTVRI